MARRCLLKNMLRHFQRRYRLPTKEATIRDNLVQRLPHDNDRRCIVSLFQISHSRGPNRCRVAAPSDLDHDRTTAGETFLFSPLSSKSAVAQRDREWLTRSSERDRTDYFSWHPGALALSYLKPGAFLRSFLGLIKCQPPLVVFLGGLHGCERYYYVLFADSQKTADANHKSGDLARLVNENIIDISDLALFGS